MASFRVCGIRKSDPASSMLVALGLLLAPSLASAQQGQPTPVDPQSPLQGVVVDEMTFEPIRSATITIIETGQSVGTNMFGSFAFPDPPIGPVTLRITAPDHVTIVQDVQVRENRIAHLQVELPHISSILSGVLVRGQPGAVASEPTTAADIVGRRVPGLLTPQAGVGDVDRAVRLRGVSSFTQGGDPHLFVDGVRIEGAGAIYERLTRIPADDVERVDVLRGPAAAFLYPYAANGIIHVYTKSGGGRSQ